MIISRANASNSVATRVSPLATVLMALAISGQSSAQIPENLPAANSSADTQQQTVTLPVQEATAPPQPLATPATPVLLQEGAIIEVELLDTLSSKVSKQGDIFRMKTRADISVQGRVVIPAGSIGYGTITYVEPRRMLGQAGELFYRFEYVKVGDRQIKIRSSQGGTGKDSTGSTIALVALFGVFGMLKKGADIVIPAGTKFEVFNAQNAEFSN